MARIDLVEDFAIKRIVAETPESFHKIDIDDVIQVYIDLFGTDPADDIKKNRGGMMNINDMIRPLGYALGGPAGMQESERDNIEFAKIMKDLNTPENKEGPGKPGMMYNVLQAISGDNTIDPFFKVKEKVKDLGERGFEGIRSLFGARAAEAGPLVDFIKSKRSRLMSEVSGEMMGNIFGTGVNEDKIKILKIEIDKLTKQLEDLGEN